MAAKKEEAPPRVLLGRPSNSLSMGIVGLPNVGKSTLFNILTKLSVPAENYPFCTIEPNEARVSIPDARYDWLVEFWQPASRIPAVLSVTDIAGLIRGAHKGEGLGNAFLANIRAVDGIFHVVRIFEDEDITHVDGSIDPIRDIETVSEELMLKDEEMVANFIEATERALRIKKDKRKTDELEVLKKVQQLLQAKKPVRFAEWKLNDVEFLNTLQLLSAKPVVYLVNMSEPDYFKKASKWLAKIKKYSDEHGGEPLIPFCGAFEAKLLTLGEEECKKFCEEKKTTTSIPKIIGTGYHALELIHFLTCGTDEVRCWTIRKGTKAPQAAGVIHTDFEKGFICAEVMKYEDFKELKSERGSEGCWKTEARRKELCCM